jgi:hypothetical protein
MAWGCFGLAWFRGAQSLELLAILRAQDSPLPNRDPSRVSSVKRSAPTSAARWPPFKLTRVPTASEMLSEPLALLDTPGEHHQAFGEGLDREATQARRTHTLSQAAHLPVLGRSACLSQVTLCDVQEHLCAKMPTPCKSVTLPLPDLHLDSGCPLRKDGVALACFKLQLHPRSCRRRESWVLSESGRCPWTVLVPSGEKEHL